MAIAVGTPEEVAAEPGSHTGRLPGRAPHAAAAADGAPRAPRKRRAQRGRGGLDGRDVGARRYLRSCRLMSSTAGQARLWAQKWRWYERNSLPWNRARIHWELMRREAFVRWPVHGNVLEALREGRLEVGAGALLEPGVWITAPGDGARADRRGHVPEPRRDGRRAGARRDRRALHARQRLLRLRRQPPLRRPRRSRSPGRASRARGRRGSATTAGWGRTSW